MPSSGNDQDPEEPAYGTEASQTLQEFERLVADLARPKYLFRLYVAGGTARSSQAITNVRNICEQYLGGCYDLEVIDVYQQPATTKAAEVIALPTLIKELPFPPKRFVGDMSNTERIVVGLKLRS
ncbi:MAG TPA: circadian clock KaiB family protein [Silvibacterium sp.]|nr:circadian clock KaiB family protein [Silvibacterium sp.]